MSSTWRTRVPVVGAIVLLASLAVAQAQTTGAGSINNENRLFQRFIEDGAVTAGVWVEPQFRFQRFGNRDVYTLGPVIAVNVAEDVEVGGRINLETLNFNPGGTQTGFTDMEVYGKVRLTTSPSQVSLGALLKFPTGETSKLLGTGETDVAFFLGYRRDFKGISFVANGGFRITQDPDTNPPGLLEGESSVQLGGAALFAFTSKTAGVVEASYETERINGAGSDFRLTIGGEHRHTDSFMSRVGLAWGSGNSAPDFELIVSGVYLF
jgi:hypothetical protein